MFGVFQVEKTVLKFRPIGREDALGLRRTPCSRCGKPAEQIMPVIEILPFSEHVQAQEQPSATGVSVSASSPQFTQLVAHRMECEGNQIQRHQRVGQAIFTVTEIVFHIAYSTQNEQLFQNVNSDENEQ